MKVYQVLINKEDIDIDAEGQMVLWIASEKKPQIADGSKFYNVDETTVEPGMPGIDLII